MTQQYVPYRARGYFSRISEEAPSLPTMKAEGEPSSSIKTNEESPPILTHEKEQFLPMPDTREPVDQRKVILRFPGQMSLPSLPWSLHRFPDKEALVRINPQDVAGKDVGILCSTDYLDEKLIPLLLLAQTATDYGARSVGLIAPYLGYMRQDKRFEEGESLSSKIMGSVLSHHFHWLITLDPHLHRYKDLSEVYHTHCQVLHVVKPIVAWIQQFVPNPVLVGPDEESRQWTEAIAQRLGAPFVILEKKRWGDYEVEVSIPSIPPGLTPVLIDDVISTGQTMIAAVKQLPSPICIGVHGLFVGNAYLDLLEAGAVKVVTCNTVQHPSNAIDVRLMVMEAFLRA